MLKEWMNNVLKYKWLISYNYFVLLALTNLRMHIDQKTPPLDLKNDNQDTYCPSYRWNYYLEI